MGSPIELITAIYKNGMEADRAYEELKTLDQKGEIHLLDAVTLKKDKDGKVTISEHSDPDRRQGARFGAVVGIILGLVAGGAAGPFGLAAGGVIGSAAGAAVGGAVAGSVDSGTDNDYLRDFAQRLPETDSAIMVVVEDGYIDRVLEVIDAYEANIELYDIDFRLGKRIHRDPTDVEKGEHKGKPKDD